MLAHDMLAAGVNEVMVAGGLESMTNAPYLMDKARRGLRMGHGKVWDHMFLDGLEDAYEPGRLMGAYAEDTAQHYQFTREAQDDFAISSLKRARAANEDGSFERETEPVTVRTRKGEVTVTQDEQPFNADLGKIPKLKPAFRKDGTVTPANSSSISDGASALVLTTQSEAEKRGLTPRARIAAHATHAQEPAWFTTAPVGAIDKVLERAGWTKADVDLYEVNEAFAVVTMAAMKEHGLAPRHRQRPWRRLCAGPPDRRLGRADYRDPAERDGAEGRRARRRLPVHRRRRSDGRRHRAAALSTPQAGRA